MTRAEVNTLVERLKAELPALAAKLGVSITYKGGTFGTSLVAKIELANIGAGGVAETQEAGDFKRFAHLDGLEPTDLYRTFTQAGETFKIVGYRAKAHTRPILCEKGGKLYSYPADLVKFRLQVAATAAG